MNSCLSGMAAGCGRHAAMLLFFGLLAACTPVKPFVPEPSQVAHGQGRLWQVDGDGLDTSYVFATFDLPDKRVQELPPAVEEAFQRSKVLAFEGLGDPYVQAELYKEENLELSGDENWKT